MEEEIKTINNKKIVVYLFCIERTVLYISSMDEEGKNES
jgi:hypothetical protein